MKLSLKVFAILIGAAVFQAGHAGYEGFRFYPAFGEIGSVEESAYASNARTNFMAYKMFGNKYLFDEKTEATLNRYLIIKALEIGVSNNEQFKNNIQIIDETFTKLEGVINSLSFQNFLETKFGEILGDTEIFGLVTSGVDDLVDKDLSIEAYISNLLKLILETEYVESLITNTLGINKATYEFYKTAIIGSVNLVIGYLDSQKIADKWLWTLLPRHQFIKALSTSFSKFIGIPIAVYEGALQTFSLGKTAAALYSLNTASSNASVKAWATSFIYDYVNIYKGNIHKMKEDVEAYYLTNQRLGGVLLSKANTTVTTFFDIFFWYTVKNLGVSNISTHRANLVRSARLALDLIEKYGNGGNFSTYAFYRLQRNALGGYEKKLTITGEPVGGFDLLYYMPPIEPNRSDDDSIWFDFYNAFGATPNLQKFRIDFSLSRLSPSNFEYVVALNERKIKSIGNVSGQHVVDSKMVAINQPEKIYLAISPKITLRVKNQFGLVYENSVTYKEFYMPLGYDYSLNDSLTGFDDELLVGVYNKGLLDIEQGQFNHSEAVTADFFLKLMYSYLFGLSNVSLDGTSSKSFFWNKCVQDKLCGPQGLIKNRYGFLTRGQVAEAITSVINFDALNLIKRNSYQLVGWTPSGVTLFENGIMNGDVNQQMNHPKLIRMIEAIALVVRTKNVFRQ